MPAPHVAVIGGGLAGLVAARRLATTNQVAVFETTERFGGKLETALFRGRPLDPGPDNFITRNPAASELARALGLGEQLISPSARGAAVFARGRLRPLPGGLAIGIPTRLSELWSSGVVSRSEALRAGLDYLAFRPALRRSDEDGQVLSQRGEADPTVASVLGRRLGGAVLDTLIDPLIGGINASDIGSLSFAAALPQLVPAMTTRRSVMRALRHLSPSSTVAGSAPAVFAGLLGGIESLIRALLAECRARGIELRSRSAVRSLVPLGSPSRWQLETDDSAEEFDAVVLAAPAFATAQLLQHRAKDAARLLSEIPYADVVTMTLAFPEAAVPPMLSRRLAALGGRAGNETVPLLPGAGVLVPRRAGRLITAASFTSTKWPDSAQDGEVLVRASAGRHNDRRAPLMDDHDLEQAVRADLAAVLGITDAPLDRLIRRFPRSFPQYVQGHAVRVAAVRHAGSFLPPIAFAGAAYDGIGIPACIVSADRAAVELSAALN